MYNHELVLIGANGYEQDEIGNDIPIETRRSVLCKVKSVGRTEYYAAATSELRPEIVFTMHKYEYNDEKKVEFEGKRYTVIRPYAINFEEIELTCERVGADVKG